MKLSNARKTLAAAAVGLVMAGTVVACSAEPARPPGYYCPPTTQRFCEGGQCICIQR